MIKNTLILIFFIVSYTINAQQVIDKVVAVVGEKAILLSEIENQKLQALQQGVNLGSHEDCFILDELLFQKLLLNQAEVDSIEVTEDMVTTELDQRIQYFAAQIGGISELETFYEKSIQEIKEEFYVQIEERMLAQKMQQEIIGAVSISPKEVKTFFNSFDKDSIPFVNSKVQVAQIVIKPEISKEHKQEIKDKLNDIRNRIIAGEISFAVAAEFYSCDPGSQAKGGDFGWVTRGDFVPEFDAVAFNAPIDSISQIFESPFGFHIAVIKERKGEQYYGSHILLCKQVNESQLAEAQSKLKIVKNKINSNELTWEEAVKKYSTDDKTKGSNGVIFNEASGQMLWDMKELDKQIFVGIKDLGVNEISDPIYMETPGGDFAYRLLFLLKQTKPHKANLNDDYQMIHNYALSAKKQQETIEWVNKKVKSTFIKIDDTYKNCLFNYQWILQP